MGCTPYTSERSGGGLVSVDGQGDLVPRVAQVDILGAAGERAIFFIVAVELGQFLLVRGFQVPLPFAQCGSPRNLRIVFGIEDDVRTAVVLSAVIVAHVDAVDLVEQRLVRREGPVPLAEEVQDSYGGGEVFLPPDAPKGRRFGCRREAPDLDDGQIRYRYEIEHDLLAIHVELDRA